MKFKILLLLIIIAATAAFVGFRDKEPESQKKVGEEIYTAAVETAQQMIKSAQAKNAKEFATHSFEFRKNYRGYYECYLLLQNVRPPANVKWQVRKDSNSGNINVSCTLDKKRKLLIVLKKLPDNSMKFAYACTLNT